MSELERFKVVEVLSRRTLDQTCKCEDAQFGQVVLKVFEGVSEHQKSRLQTLSRALLNLSHPALQEHLGCFEETNKIALAFRWVEGQTLAQEIQNGVRYNDQEIFEQMARVLEALALAHSLEPALVHRDIKPENVVHSSNGWVLIDFGASRAALGDGKASVAGTTGYAAPEQFFGTALPASDQYGLAATVLHVATHRHPTEFPLRKLHLEIGDAGLSSQLTSVLNRMLAPELKDRFEDTETALRALQSGFGMQEWQAALAPLSPTETVLSVKALDDSLEINIGPRLRKFALLSSAVALLSLAAFFYYSYSGPEAGFGGWVSNFGQVFVFVWLWGIPAMRELWLASRRARLLLSPEGWKLESAGKLVSEGTRPPEILQEFGLFQGNSVKLRDVDKVSPGFGFSLNFEEAQALSGIVAAYFRPIREVATPRVADESEALILQVTDLQRLGERPSPLRTASYLNQTFRVLPSTPKREAYFKKIPQTKRTLLETKGFRRVGFLKDAVLWVFGTQKEVWLNQDGTIAVHVWPCKFDAEYFMATLMSDGRYRLTGSVMANEGLVSSFQSTGDFEKDLEAHRSWIAEQMEVHNSLPVVMESIEDRVSTFKYYVRHLEPQSQSFAVLALVAMVLVTAVLTVSIGLAFIP